MSPSIEAFDEAKYEALMDGLEITEIEYSDLERTKRIDSEFYSKMNMRVVDMLKTWNKVSFADTFYVSDGNHMSISDYFTDEGVPYYRGQDIYSLFIENSSPMSIPEAIYNKPQMHRSHLKKGDVLMSIVGAIVGNSSIVSSDKKATCSCKLAILRSKENIILPEMLLVYIKTQYGQNQIQKFKRGAAQTGLLLEDFDQLYIPVFGKAFQQIIAAIVKKVYDLEQQAVVQYAQAESILTDITQVNSNGVAFQNIAIKYRSESLDRSGRLDAEYYHPKFTFLMSQLMKQKCLSLGTLVEIKKSIEPGSDAYTDTGIPFVRVSDITKFGIAKPEIHLACNVVENPQMLYPQQNTILFSKDGSVGIAYKVEKDEEFITSGALLHLVVQDKATILPDYLTLVLNSPIVQLQAERDSSGAIIQHWKPSEVEAVQIPILDFETQRMLSEKVRHSFTLRNKASSLIDNAKQAVEIAIEKGEQIAIDWLAQKEAE